MMGDVMNDLGATVGLRNWGDDERQKKKKKRTRVLQDAPTQVRTLCLMSKQFNKAYEVKRMVKGYSA